MKVLGGITGITQAESSLENFFLIAPELSRLVKEFGEFNAVTESKEKRQRHHELSGSKHKRVFDNAAKMKDVLMEHGSPFAEKTKEVMNVMSKAVMTDNIKQGILQRDLIGQKLHETFVTERLVKGTKSVWAPMKKVNLKLFKNSAMNRKTKVKEKIIELREERDLLARFVIVLRTRPDIDILISGKPLERMNSLQSQHRFARQMGCF